MTILGYPIQALFLYFIFYSFLGWLMETCYCSILEHRLVDRGFLYGPICPIYGAGVLLMILFFTPLKHSLILFYLTAVVVMTAWEYFVAWILETTTHVRYWDYSRYRFNIKGRVCLWVALVWGVLSYLVIFWIQPAVEGIYQIIPGWLVTTLCVALLVLLVVDAALTIRHLALVSHLVVKLSEARDEAQVQLSLGKAELGQLLENQSAALRNSYTQQVARLERYSRSFRRKYSNMHLSSRYASLADDLKASAAAARKELLKKRETRKNTKRKHA